MLKTNKVVIALSVGLLMIPLASQATFDFVVNQGILLSPGKWFADDTIKVYTVVVNNNFNLLSADVQFTSNGNPIAKVSVTDLPFEGAKQVGVDVKLHQGPNSFEAKMQNVVVQDKSGKTINLTEDQIVDLGAQRQIIVDVDTDKDQIGDTEDPDDDNDKLTDEQEKTLGTDSKKADTDGDTLSDKQEVDGKTNPLKVDTDGDGLTDGEEENKYGTDPKSADTDGDGLSDKKEISLSLNPKLKDSDNDGLGDKEELDRGTNPLDADTDKDGVKDGVDAFPLDKNESKDADHNGRGDNADAALLAAQMKKQEAEQKAIDEAARQVQLQNEQQQAQAEVLQKAKNDASSNTIQNDDAISNDDNISNDLDGQIEQENKTKWWILGGGAFSFIGFLVFSALYATAKRSNDDVWE